jgi:TPR repeat protein
MHKQRELAARLDDQPGRAATASAGGPAADPAAPRESGRLITFNSNGGTVADGVQAYRAGDFSTAERIWGALAASGDPRAQFHFGALMYEGGTSEPDLVMAHVWLSRAVDGGHLPAIELRRRVRAAMSEAQYQEALAIQTTS